MKYSLSLLLWFALVISYAQTSSDFLTKLNGQWAGTGKAFNMPADITMSWEKTLNNQFYQLRYRMDMKAPDGNIQTFEGTAFYKIASEKELVATWFDSGGEMHPIKASIDTTSLTAIWGTPETKLGKTIYQFTSDKTVEITDFIQNKKGEWKQFNKNTVKR
jgi:hypothetical protein